MLKRLIRRSPATAAFLAAISIIYGLQLLAAGSLESGAAETAASSLSKEMYMILAPFLHSNHSHIFQNALIFGLFGYWCERRTGWPQYLVFVLTAGYLSLYVPVAYDFGGLSIGISGVTKGFMAFFSTYHFIQLLKTGDEPLRVAGYHFVLWMVPFFYLFVTIGRFLGMVDPPSGTSVGSHLVGLVLGVLWYGYWGLLRREDWWLRLLEYRHG